MNGYKDKSNNDEGYLSSSSSNDENYIITTKVCKRLSKEFDLPEIVFEETIRYDAPIENGLSNSDIIIPSYYKLHKHPSKILNIDFYEIIKDDIRKCRILNKYQLEYIKEIQDEYKYELIDVNASSHFAFKTSFSFEFSSSKHLMASNSNEIEVTLC